jgi:methylenetetrahydrofolate dehydrogenase (NADP+)/methenyltetrahydrofolate cyclohydrolase
MQIIDGKALAANIRDQVKQEIEASGLHPKLAVLLVGENPASKLYVDLKEKACREVGIETDIRRLPDTASEDELRDIIQNWNADKTVHAILIQIPLPKKYDQDALIALMDPAKDVDGFHPKNLQAIADGTAEIFPPVHEGILRLIAATDITLNGTSAVIIANSEIFSAPLLRLLTRAGCLVTKFNPEDLERDAVKDADILVVAVGRANFLTQDLIKSGACVIDVGTNRLADGKVTGDVDAKNLKTTAGRLSPVPGGVGPMTVAMLLKNTLTLATRRSSPSHPTQP